MGMDLTLYFCLSSLERGEDINLRRMCDGAVKWRFLFFLRDAVTSLLNFIVITPETWTTALARHVNLKVRSRCETGGRAPAAAESTLARETSSELGVFGIVVSRWGSMLGILMDLLTELTGPRRDVWSKGGPETTHRLTATFVDHRQFSL